MHDSMMKGKKVLGLLEDAGGHATTKELRALALERYPGLTLHRTLHTTLKELLDDKQILFDASTELWIKPPTIHEQSEEDMRAFEQNINRITLKVLPDEMQPKKIIMKPEDMDPNAVYHIDGNKEPIDPTGKIMEDAKYHYAWSRRAFKYRDKHEIACSVIQAIVDGKTRTTAIMYTAWLSHYQLRKYLMTLTKNELITQVDKNVYHVTPKGLEYIDAMKKASQIKFD